ncbi:NACHT, LRR and PYD domains-containing protein 6 isoform X3 [Pantherophis guttatus]|uniref:NACHT, LRR and PYD domains-containing protein 6 isoform X3 n=1 Tax=Pantherophis guttatus TaxID=94885 RepID=A0A6P9C814_PANGU|nr:NACHT, LRR and PYD domains-containing protein 6 isoform X3 [Pantherophis guttatus]
MNNTMREDLYNSLNDLLEKQFNSFKWWLKFINHNGKPNIPTASLEKANQQEVVDLLIQYYGEDAVEVCIYVLKKSNIYEIAKKLEETLQIDIDAHRPPDSSDYRSHIQKKFQTIEDPNSIPGEYVSLNQRYSSLIILDYHRSEEEREDEILATGRKHVEIISKRAKSSTNIKTLFNPDKCGLIPQVVVLQGAAGIGKTMMAKKIMLDWASQQLYQDKFNYIFYIYCREMNLHAEPEKSSIAEIISKQWPKYRSVKNVTRNILKNEEKLLFIIDGFDELRYSFDQSEDDFCTDPWKKEPMRILLSSLFKKKLLPESCLIITTRPIALEKLHRCLEHPRYFQILGFSTKEREEYFYNFFENINQASQALRFVKQNDMLFTMCVIPLVSWIICTVVKQEMERGKDLQKTPCTLTAIYMLYLSSLLKFHHKESKQDIRANVKGLCSLATEGIWKQQILFMEEEVKKHSFDQEQSLSLFLNENLFKRDIDCIQTYSFIHLSFQEFFAALFYVLEGEERHSENQNKHLQTLLERHTYFRSDFAVGFRFLFGFLNEDKRMRELKKEFGWEIFPNNKEFLLDWVKNNIKTRIYFNMQKEMFSYLYETQDDNFVKNALDGITEINYQCNLDMELMILAYCIQHCQNLENLHIENHTFLYQAEKELFLPENEKWSLDERYVEDFFKALTKLRHLQILRLPGGFLTKSCSRHLEKTFRRNQRLEQLELSPVNADGKAMELLCAGLQHPDCKVKELQLSEESLNESFSKHLAEVLRKNQGLRVLKLFFKNTDDRAAEMLCEGLQCPECKIKELCLHIESLTESFSRPLAEVFKKNQTLREFELFPNSTDERATEILCEGLKHPDCKIEVIRLNEEFLRDSCRRHIAGVLRINQTLRELYLHGDHIRDNEEKLLCEELKHSGVNGKCILWNGKWMDYMS